jgi:hypothetical protein
MTIEFGRGAFENPDDPSHGDDVDTSIVVVTAPEHLDATRGALERCRERWWGIDGAGRFHGADDAAFWTAQTHNHGPEWHTAKYVSDVGVDAGGVTVDVDCQGLMPAAMRAAYRDVLVEELAAAGIDDAIVRSSYSSDYEPVEEPPSGRWPPYAGEAVPGLPPGVPPGRVFHQTLRRHGAFRNWLLQRDFDDVWEASAVGVVEIDEEEAVGGACRRFGDAGWAVGDPRACSDWDGNPLTAAAMSCPGAVALVTCQAAAHVRGRGLAIPRNAERVVIAVAYYDLVPPGLDVAGEGA